jgi:hypothetical protein
MGLTGLNEGWRKLHSHELHNIYSSPSNIRVTISRMTLDVEHMGENRSSYIVLVGKTEDSLEH